jgi:hypothetical protein
MMHVLHPQAHAQDTVPHCHAHLFEIKTQFLSVIYQYYFQYENKTILPVALWVSFTLIYLKIEPK